jgi:hypothetical protein
MEQFLATLVNSAHLTRQGCRTALSALPLEAAFSLPETGGFLRSDVDDLFEAIPVGLSLATSDEDGLDELLPGDSTARQSDVNRTVQMTRTPNQSRS